MKEHPAAKIAYVLLWFPLASETFIFSEIENLRSRNLDVSVYSMYGQASRGLSEQMSHWHGPVCRFGAKSTSRIWRAFWRAFRSQPAQVWKLMKEGLFRRMRNLESQAENTWCFMAGFLLAEECRAAGIGLIHSAWANGPATAAWIASRLSGIPFAFSGRAGDIYPEDGLLREKARDATFIRVNNAANIQWLQKFCPPDQKDKVKLIYNGLTFPACRKAARKKDSDVFRLLAVGRFARTKGFPELFTALARLKRERLPVSLTLIGDGSWKRKLLELRKRMGLEDMIEMPGFVPNDMLSAYMAGHDLLVVPSVIHTNGDRDGIPNVIMEASCSGLPVVATDVCGISEVIRNSETGWLVPQRDPAALANAIREAMESPEKASTLAYNAMQLVIRMFDSQKNGEALASLYLHATEAANA